MSQNLMIVPAFDDTNYGYWKAHMRFFLKSIDCWKTVEIGWTQPKDTNIELVTEEKKKKKTHDLPMIKPSILYVKLFHHLNLQKFKMWNHSRSMANLRNNI
jgi:hypothetical protein